MIDKSHFYLILFCFVWFGFALEMLFGRYMRMKSNKIVRIIRCVSECDISEYMCVWHVKVPTNEW